MAWAMTHFFFGASIGLIISLLLSYHIESILEYRLLIMYLAGVFALIPDLKNPLRIISPRYSDIYQDIVHDSVASNIFMFHHLLDRDIFRSSQVEILAFFITIFTIALILIQLRLRFFS